MVPFLVLSSTASRLGGATTFSTPGTSGTSKRTTQTTSHGRASPKKTRPTIDDIMRPLAGGATTKSVLCLVLDAAFI